MAVWLVRGGRRGEREAEAVERGVATIGFDELGDLSHVQTMDEMSETLRVKSPDAKEGRRQNFARQLFAFVRRIQIGDIVVLPMKTTGAVAFGRVEGPYEYTTTMGDLHHVRRVKWITTDYPRASIDQDLLYSLGAFMTVCQIKRNQAEERINKLLKGLGDPGTNVTAPEVDEEEAEPATTDVERIAMDEIVARIRERFQGHDLAWLVEAVLAAQGLQTRLSPPGPDGGVDIVAGLGPLGLDGGRLCVQVKSSASPADVAVLRGLQGSMQTFQASQGLLVSWGGFNSAVQKEAALSWFSVRLWTAEDLLREVLTVYEKLPKEIQNELPLKRIWSLVPDE